jgi:hypothetical protein
MAGIFHSFPGAVDVLDVGTGETGYLSVFNDLRNGTHGFKVTITSGREASFDDVHTKGFKLTGNTELIVEVHGSAGGLFTVAERRIENYNAVRHFVLL